MNINRNRQRTQNTQQQSNTPRISLDVVTHRVNELKLGPGAYDIKVFKDTDIIEVTKKGKTAGTDEVGYL